MTMPFKVYINATQYAFAKNMKEAKKMAAHYREIGFSAIRIVNSSEREF